MSTVLTRRSFQSAWSFEKTGCWERRKWTYGQRKKFYWGRYPLRSSEDKWIILLRDHKIGG
ncbi:hypothetical protein C8R48DRAFT_714367 [Suillus tomentosus]|nr:hypothetical protein C8R48DRAFT_714367 [Suillus tomentosus]